MTRTISSSKSCKDKVYSSVLTALKAKKSILSKTRLQVLQTLPPSIRRLWHDQKAAETITAGLRHNWTLTSKIRKFVAKMSHMQANNCLR